MLVYDIQSLCKRYPGQTQLANDHIDLSIEQGEIFGILGDNGAGKSTLVKQMANLMRPTSGQINLFGQPMEQHVNVVASQVGYMPQSASALNNLSVDEALYFTAHLRGLSRKEALRARDVALEMWQLGPLRHIYSPRLSGGQQRLLQLAVALVGLPPIVILDEPTNELDPQNRRLVWNNLRRLNSEHGITVIFITHDAIEAEKVIQRVAIMRAGKIVALGRPNDLKRSTDQKFRLTLFFDPDTPPQLPSHIKINSIEPGRWLILFNRAELDDLLAHLKHTQIDDFHIFSATLEDLYLHYAQQPK